MTEPTRVGLTPATDSKLDELLDELNPHGGEEGVKLIKFDLYRLAVALGVSRSDAPPILDDKSSSSLRKNELDPDGVLSLAVESSGLIGPDDSRYEFIERLAERGISELYEKFQQTGQLPLDEYFGD